MVKSKLKKMLNSNDVFLKQVDGYKLIHDKALTSMKKQLSMVDKLADYNGLTKIKYSHDLDKKKQTFQNLEVGIVNVKQNSVDQQIKLSEIENKYKHVQLAIKEQERRNYHSKNSNENLQ